MPTGMPQALKVLEKERVVQLKQGRFGQRTHAGVGGRTRLLLSPFAFVFVPISLLFLLSGLPSFMLGHLQCRRSDALERLFPLRPHILLSLSVIFPSPWDPFPGRFSSPPLSPLRARTSIFLSLFSTRSGAHEQREEHFGSCGVPLHCQPAVLLEGQFQSLHGPRGESREKTPRSTLVILHVEANRHLDPSACLILATVRLWRRTFWPPADGGPLF